MTTITKPKSWREKLLVHPAADMFPLMSADELRELGEDIKKNGLTSPITILAVNHLKDGWSYSLLDGRNRLDAIELAGFKPTDVSRRGRAQRQRDGIESGLDVCLGLGGCEAAVRYVTDVDPYAYVVSANINRRHLTAEQKRDLIAKLLKATPEKSDRQIAATVKASPTTVGSERAKLEAKGELSKLDSRVGKDRKTRQQPAKRKTAAESAKAGEERDQPTRMRPCSFIRPTLREARGTTDATGPSGESIKAVVFPPVPAKPAPAKPARDDIGENSTGELQRLRARIEELEAENVRLKQDNDALRRENARLDQALTWLKVEHERAPAPPAAPATDDCGDLPEFLRRQAP